MMASFVKGLEWDCDLEAFDRVRGHLGSWMIRC